MKQQAFIFIGRSGSGKGTQVDLLIKKLSELDPQRKSIHVSTGQQLREFIQGDTYTQKYTRDQYNAGGLMPEFLTVFSWTTVVVREHTGDNHIFMDGSPRRLHEAGALHSMLEYFKYEKPWVIFMDISEEEAMKRLLARKRMDDDPEEIKKRLAWYETDVTPALEYYDGNPSYTFIKVNGGRSIEEVHADIVKKVGLE